MEQSPYQNLAADCAPAVKPLAVTLPRLKQMQREGEKITMLTAYDATFAALADDAGVDCLLVGDSLGMVCQGHESTVPVRLEDVRYHTEAVARGTRRSGGRPFLLADMPFGSYGGNPNQAFANACVLMQAGAQMVKLEGDGWTASIVEFFVSRGVPVCAHLGLTPQHVHALGGYRLQAKTDEAARQLLLQARELQSAGAGLLVLEMVPASVAQNVTEMLTDCPTIGIGAGSATAGQVLVLHDMIGATTRRIPKFVRNFMVGTGSLPDALRSYVAAVKSRSFPIDAEHAW
ncbi:3-methyl-2-oxobutanoate hydroxymethyltransferase [Verminephrobacter aporrectodeae]|uniref:3-methyl-2-oxobutanoate hydroxymethyltransferase n=1 Tax=Verminephrobacter aporrectodeae TaxID=1110389 RepID=UPI002238C33E|nr:3-methyl-2-oxobutanoate hydroxymethyltransferase [Verminephrobacter aporrectodeae]